MAENGFTMADDGGKALCEPFVWARPAQDGSGFGSPRRAAGGGVAVVATPPGVRPSAGCRSMRSRTVCPRMRGWTRVTNYRQNTYADSGPANPDTSDTVTDPQRSVGNTEVWNGAEATTLCWTAEQEHA